MLPDAAADDDPADDDAADGASIDASVDARSRRGAWLDDAGTWHFALASDHARSVELHVFRRADPAVAHVVRRLDSDGQVWRCTVPAAELAAAAADVYGYRVDGPWERPGRPRFDHSKLLLDPYAESVWFPPAHDRDAARIFGQDTAGQAPLAVLVPRRSWRPTVPRPHVAHHERVVMEVHVRGATASPTSPVDAARRGTLAGLADLVDHWADLGVTVVELMPLHQYDPLEGNYWGYMPLAFGAVHGGYAASGDGWDELCRFVDAAHSAGIQVWVDVVLNHTAEEDSERGPTLSLRGIDRQLYYLLRTDGTDVDDAGCGNVVRAGHPELAALLLEALERFADAGVDGFRFDLATLLGRDDPDHSAGDGLRSAGAIPAITEWAAQRDVALIAEPWDLASYQLGEAFPGRSWMQWNGRFRDDVRSFLRGDDGYVRALAERVSGSPDVFGANPWRSLNFVTSHDGFTLYDLFSYDRKHNTANGWHGTDGTDDNRSWNHGHEGDDGVPADVTALRLRQMRNALCLLMLSAGVPMFVAGDEMAHTQRGNNNPYNQDNTTTWLDWTRLHGHRDLQRFVRELIALRRATPSIGRRAGWGDDVHFYGVDGGPDLSHHSHSLAWFLSGAQAGCQSLYVMANAWTQPLRFAIQQPGPWWRAIDTSLTPPADIVAEGSRELVVSACTVQARSVVVLTRPAAG